MKKILEFIKKEAVLSAAWILAVISAFFVRPSAAYLDYIDFRSLAILWSLMVIMKVFQKSSLFEVLGERLMKKASKVGQLCLCLIFLCFFSSMAITNDVALITFVPFAVMTLKGCGKTELLIPVIALQTVAANLGSMMTPVGNPQNLYLYNLSGLSFAEFAVLVGPYVLVSGIMLALCVLFLKGRSEDTGTSGAAEKHIDRKLAGIYAGLFALALLTVFRVVPYPVLAAAVLGVTAFISPESLLKADYSLLLTFTGFFIFTGNMGAMPSVSELISRFAAGREVFAGVVLSQVISNVPAALLLSGFSDDIPALILGTDIGGLGTLIASMASLISFKLLAAEAPDKKGRYLLVFTVFNLAFLAVLSLLCAVLA